MKTEERYLLGEDDIVKISRLFLCLEEALKELIRWRANRDVPGPAEMTLYRETSLVLLDRDENWDFTD